MPYAIINPHTVVVHSQDTSVAFSTVMSAGGLEWGGGTLAAFPKATAPLPFHDDCCWWWWWYCFCWCCGSSGSDYSSFFYGRLPIVGDSAWVCVDDGEEAPEGEGGGEGEDEKVETTC